MCYNIIFSVHHFQLALYIYLCDVHSKMIIINSTNRTAVFLLSVCFVTRHSLSLFPLHIYIFMRPSAYLYLYFPLRIFSSSHSPFISIYHYFGCDAIHLLQYFMFSNWFFDVIVSVVTFILW